MRVLAQGSSPGVQHAREAKPTRADVLGVLRQLDQRGRGRLEHRVIALAWMRSDEAAQLLRNGERDQEVGTRQEFFQFHVEPLFGLVPLALRTMAVAARLRHHVIAPTRITVIDGRSEFPGAATFERLHHPEMLATHAIGIFRAIRRAVAVEDLTDRRSGRSSMWHSELVLTHRPPADRS